MSEAELPVVQAGPRGAAVRAPAAPPPAPVPLHRLLRSWALGWWRLLHFGAEMMVLMVSPSSYLRGRRQVLYRHLVAAAAPLLLPFVAASSLVSLVIIRIVLATASSYDLSRYALDVLVRTLVIELLPLLVATFVAVRYTLPAGERVAHLRAQGVLWALWRSGRDPARDELLPRVVAGVFTVVLLAALSCLLALLLTYLSVYGFTTWGFDAYTRKVGQIFSPGAALIFALKALFFSLAVAVLPMAPAAREPGAAAGLRHDNIGQLGRLFAVVLVVEVVSLVGNYY